MTNAIRNSLGPNLTADVNPGDSPMGLSLALSPTSTTTMGVNSVGVSKAAITNASFKTRKLPDDIPIVASASNTTQNSTPGTTASTTLTSINEEAEGDGTPNNVKNTSKSSSTPTGKMTAKMSQLLHKSDRHGKEKKKEKDHHGNRKLSKTSSAENGTESSPGATTINNQVINRSIAFIEENATTADNASDSETRSYSSQEHEAIPLTNFNSAKSGSVTSRAFDHGGSEEAKSNCSSSSDVHSPLVVPDKDTSSVNV